MDPKFLKEQEKIRALRFSPFSEAVGLGYGIHCVLAIAPHRIKKDDDDANAIEYYPNFASLMASNHIYVVRNFASKVSEFLLMSNRQMEDFGKQQEAKSIAVANDKKWPEKKHAKKHKKVNCLLNSDSFEEVIYFNLGYNRFVLDVDCPLDIPLDMSKVVENYGHEYTDVILPEMKRILYSNIYKFFEKEDPGIQLLACLLTSANRAMKYMEIINEVYVEDYGPKAIEFVVKSSIFDVNGEILDEIPKWSFHILTKNVLSSSRHISRMFALLTIYFMIATYLDAEVLVDSFTVTTVPQSFDEIWDSLIRQSRRHDAKRDEAKFLYSIIDLGLYSDTHNLRLAGSKKPNKEAYTDIITCDHTFMDSVVRPSFDDESDIRFYKVLLNERLSKEASRRGSKEYDVDSIEDEFIQNAIRAACLKYPEFEFRDIINGNDGSHTINFNRICASKKECEFCKKGRVHTNDNNLYMGIFRSPSGRFAACFCRKAREADPVNSHGICVYNERTESNSFDSRISNAIESATKDQFRGLYGQDDFDGPFDTLFTRYTEESSKKIKGLTFSNDITYIQASTGIGKTKAVGEYIKSLEKNCQVLAVSFRVALSYNLMDAFNKIAGEDTFVHYKASKDKIRTFDKLIIQVESFNRISSSAVKDNFVLVLDESESIISQLYSKLSDKENENMKMFLYLVGKAKKIIAVDAYMTVRTINVIQSIKRFYGKSPTTTMYRNIYKSHKRTKYFLTKDKNDWLGQLCYLLQEGERCVVAVNSKRDAQIINLAVTKIVKQRIEIGIYSSDTAESVKKEHFKDVNNYWDKYDLLIYTPTAGAGISFEKNHYDYLFGFFTSASCDAEACLQMLARVRNISSKRAFIYLDPNICARPLTRNEILTSFINNHESKMSYVRPDYYLDLNGRKMITESPETEIALTNLVMRNRSEADFVSRFTGILSVYAEDIQVLELDQHVHRQEYEKYREETSVKNAVDLVSAASLTKAQYIDLCSKSELNIDITADERLSMEKYGLCKLFNVDQANASDTTFKDYNKSTKKSQFINLCTVADTADLEYSLERMKHVLGAFEIAKLNKLHGELFKETKFSNCARVVSLVELLTLMGITTISGNSTVMLPEVYKTFVKKNRFRKDVQTLLLRIYDDNKLKLSLRPPADGVTYAVFVEFFKKFFTEICRNTFGLSVKYAVDDSMVIVHNINFDYQTDRKDRSMSASGVPKVMAFDYLNILYDGNRVVSKAYDSESDSEDDYEDEDEDDYESDE